MSKARDLADLAKNANDRLDDVATSDGALSNRNLIINGAMQVAQRGTSFTTQASSAYAMDRWINEHDASTFDLDFSQEAGPRDLGFIYAQKATVQTTATLTTAGYIIPFEQRIERNLTERLQWGTSDAQPFTLSFWIKSNRTGTYTVNLNMGSPTGGTDDATARQYTIDAANTWEYKTLTFPANTTTYSGAPYNARSLTLFWWMIAGSTYTTGSIPTGWENETQANRAVGCSNSTTVGDNWQITGVQLEVGDTATPFEHRSYGDELARCQRYYEVISRATSVNSYGTLWSQPLNTFSNCWTNVEYKVSKRAVPSFGLFSGVSWYNLTPNAYPTVDALVLNASGFFYVSGGSTGDPQAYLDAEL